MELKLPASASSKKAQVAGVGVGTILTLVQAFGLPVETAGYLITAIIIVPIIMQGLQDIFGKKK